MTRSVCIIHGLNEGPAMSRKLEQYLRDAGYRITAEASKADIIFAHSGGCFLIPQDNRASKIIFVGLPYWPHRSWIRATAIKIWRETKIYIQQGQIRHWLIKWSYHLRYAVRLRRGVRMAVNRSPARSWNSFQPHIVVRNRHDVYCTPQVWDLRLNGAATFISLPGEHDDCWDHPEIYAKIIIAL